MKKIIENVLLAVLEVAMVFFVFIYPIAYVAATVICSFKNCH